MQENTVCAANCTVQEKRGGQKIMLIRNATLQMSATERACMDVRVMNGCVWEMGVALVKGLYESEIDLHGAGADAGNARPCGGRKDASAAVPEALPRGRAVFRG